MEFGKLCVKGILPAALVVGVLGFFLVFRDGLDARSAPSAPLPKPIVQIALANRTLCATGFPVRFCEHQTASARGTAPYVLALANGASKAEAIRRVKECGARVIGPLPPNALLVETSVFALGKLSQDASFAAAAELLPEDKVDARLKPLLDSDAATLDVTLVALAPADVEGLVTLVGERGGERLKGCLGGKSSVTLTLPRGLVAELAKRGDVRWLEPFKRPKLLNDLAVGPTAMNVRSVWDAHGLTGKGQIVTTSDTGIDTGNLETMHADLRNRILGFRVAYEGYCYSYDANGHGTHTAGSIVGDGTLSDGQIRGTAYGAKLWAWFCGGTDGYIYTPDECDDLFRPSGATDASVHSASWGSDNAGAYEDMCAAIDEYVWEHPDFLPVIANGNAGSSSQSVGAPATAKNVLAVGATQNVRTSPSMSWSNGDPTKVSSFSSRGPCADGRIKPDVCAPGVGILSTRAYGCSYSYGVHGNTNYAYNCGTSMATPLAAGAATLVRQWLVERRGFTNAVPTAALVKAVLTGGAKNVATPDNKFGWGCVDLGESLYPSNRAVRLEDRIPFAEGSERVFSVTLTNAAPFDVQLVWIDYPATSGADSTLVNDLDLIVSNKTTGAVWFGNGVAGGDRTNTVESVRLAEAAAGEYAIIVRGSDVTYDSTQGGAAAVYLRGAFEGEDEKPDEGSLEIVSATPSASSVRMKAGATNEFSIVYTASTNLTVSCSWTLDDVTLPCAATNFTYGTTWSDHGSHALVCTVSSKDGKKRESRNWTVSVWGEIRVDAATGDDETATGSAEHPYATIAAALAQAAAGDSLLVGPGVYAGGLVASAGVSPIRAEAGPAATVIDGGGTNRCFDATADASVVLSGFTLTNGWTDASAGYADGAGAYGGTLTNCVITGCRAEGSYGYGGGAANATLVDCVIANCTAGGQGGGASGSTLVNCTVRGNTAARYYGQYSVYAGGGIDCLCCCLNTIVWGNLGPQGDEDDWEWYRRRRGPRGGSYYHYVPDLQWSCTPEGDLFGNASITNDPLFASADVADPTINELSPCIGAGADGANIGAYRGAGASIRLPEIDVKTATGEEISNAVASVGYADKAVEAGIGTNGATYAAFRAWSTNGLKSTAVVLSTRAYDSFLVREIVAAPTLLAEGKTTEVKLTALEPASDGTCSTTLRLVDGENAVPLCSVKAAFARHSQVGGDVRSLAPADVSNVEAESVDGGQAVKLTITPPAATSRYFMHFNLQP